MPIWMHLTLSMIAQGVGAFGGPILVMRHTDQVDAMGINATFAFFVSFVIGCTIPRLLFRFVIPARCPKCAGRSVPRDYYPINYNCRACGHTHTTTVYEGG